MINGAFATLATLLQQPKMYKTSTILVHEHVDILWANQEAKIKCWLLDYFLPDCVALNLTVNTNRLNPGIILNFKFIWIPCKHHT